MNLTDEKTIGELVAGNYRTAPVFKKYGIDFCCKGGRTIEDACASKGINPEPLLADLDKAFEIKDDSGNDYTAWPLDKLADYIIDEHHSYVERAILQVKPFLEKVAKVHGPGHPHLLEVRDLFFEASANLSQHMKKEELILFPFIKKMQMAKDAGEPMPQPPFGSIGNPIAMMKAEHEDEGTRFERISELTNNYLPPEYACNTWQVSFHLLKEFQDDLHKHIHLENNILFPQALELEKVLN